MAGRYLATELQDDNGDVIYPHTEADIVFTSDGTTVEENLSGDFTDAEIQEIFSDNDSQLEAGKKLSVKEKIKRALKKYQALLRMRILDTVEEVEANTDDGYLMGAKAGAALINDLVSNVYVGTDEKIHVVKGGADTVLNFSSRPISNAFSSGNTTYSTSYQIPKTYNGKSFVGISSISTNVSNDDYITISVSATGLVSWGKMGPVSSVRGTALYI